MVNEYHIKGDIGIYLVLIELLKRGIDALPTKLFWGFDIFTMSGIKIEAKIANKGKSKGGTGFISDRFTFRISIRELELLDFVVLIPNTHKGYLFYIIPKKAIDSKTIAFNPFSSQKSKYEKYLDRWDLIIAEENRRFDYKEIKKMMKKPHYLTRLYNHQKCREIIVSRHSEQS